MAEPSPAPAPPPGSRRWVVRHACAGHKDDWQGDDDVRPLDPAGATQATALAAVLAADGPTRLVSSPSRRCVDTLAPLADALDLTVDADPALRDASGTELVRLLASPDCDGAVLCTHGEVMEPALSVLRAAGLEVRGDADDEDLLLKGAAWRLDRAAPGWRLELVVPVAITTCPHHR